eukprot:SAG31_NODE_9298_length_1302_cov_1.457190_1_plen_194_part_00
MRRRSLLSAQRWDEAQEMPRPSIPEKVQLVNAHPGSCMLQYHSVFVCSSCVQWGSPTARFALRTAKIESTPSRERDDDLNTSSSGFLTDSTFSESHFYDDFRFRVPPPGSSSSTNLPVVIRCGDQQAVAQRWPVNESPDIARLELQIEEATVAVSIFGTRDCERLHAAACRVSSCTYAHVMLVPCGSLILKSV